MARPGAKPTERTLAYLAGFFDGEGCVHSHGERVSISNTYPPILETFASIFGGTIRPMTSTRKQVFQWTVCGRTGRHCLRRMLPYLIEKRPQALLYLRLLRFPRNSAMRASLHRRLRELKAISHTTHRTT